MQDGGGAARRGSDCGPGNGCDARRARQTGAVHAAWTSSAKRPAQPPVIRTKRFDQSGQQDDEERVFPQKNQCAQGARENEDLAPPEPGQFPEHAGMLREYEGRISDHSGDRGSQAVEGRFQKLMIPEAEEQLSRRQDDQQRGQNDGHGGDNGAGCARLLVTDGHRDVGGEGTGPRPR